MHSNNLEDWSVNYSTEIRYRLLGHSCKERLFATVNDNLAAVIHYLAMAPATQLCHEPS